MSDLLDELDNREAEPEFGGDYAPWWEPEEGERLIGVVAEMHSAPDKFTPEGEVPPPVYTVVSIGEGDFDVGEPYSTRTHKQLLIGFDDVELGDIVSVTYQGYKKLEGSNNPSNAYQIAVIKEEEIADFDEKWQTLVDTVLDSYDGPTGDNRSQTPVQSDNREEMQDDNLLDAAEFLKSCIKMQNGEMDVETAENMVNNVREFGVDLDAAADLIDAEISGDTISLG